MPSGPPELHEYWSKKGPYPEPYGADSNALQYLSDRGLKPNRGGVFVIPKGRALDAEENKALDYLWLEWDYASENERD